jgi:hydroxyacylglutathione hydrolase
LRLARVGIEKVEGFLAGGIAAWQRDGLPSRPCRTSPSRTCTSAWPQEPACTSSTCGVPRNTRRPLCRAPSTCPSTGWPRRGLPLDRRRPIAVVCAGGYRSSRRGASSSGAGSANLLNVVGGTAAWVQAGYDVERDAPSAAG